jgi:hypothetical protein
MDVAAVWLAAMASAWRRGLANLWIRSDGLPKQGGDGLKGGGRSVGRSLIKDGWKGEWEDVGGLAGLVHWLKCWAGRMPIVDGCAGFVSKPMGSGGDVSTGGNGRAC